MIPPPPVLLAVQAALRARTGTAVRIMDSSPVGGGCINPSARLTADTGETYFLKWNPSSPPDMFQAEADGLRALADPGSLRVPEVLGEGGAGTRENPGWLLLEYIPQGRPGPDYGSLLGRGLSELHRSPPTRGSHGSGEHASPGQPARFGWHRDNFIGSLPQRNDFTGEWACFWRDHRLEPQFRMAREQGHFSGPSKHSLEQLLEQVDAILKGASDSGPELLHGDLWSGNFYPGPHGEPVLIDPAVYRGAGEVDLAMMELFGSLPRGFREAYGNGGGLAPEYDAFRRDLYQLYYLLVHVNLFGGSYVSGSVRAAEAALRGA